MRSMSNAGTKVPASRGTMVALPRLLALALGSVPQPSAAQEAPAMSPSAAVWMSVGVTAGLFAGAATATSLGSPETGLVLAVLGDFGPELGYYATGHWGEGVGMWALRQLAMGLGAAIGLGIAYGATPEPDCSGDEMFCGLNESLALIAGSAIGGGLAGLGFAIYEWSDMSDTVTSDWNAYAETQAEASWTSRVAVAPLIVPDGRGGLLGGLDFAVRF
jgi:hypothetical protein